MYKYYSYYLNEHKSFFMHMLFFLHAQKFKNLQKIIDFFRHIRTSMNKYVCMWKLKLQKNKPKMCVMLLN